MTKCAGIISGDSMLSFLTRGSIPGLLHCRQFLYHLSHQGKPNIIYSIIQILKKVNVPFLLVHSGQLNYFCFFAWLASFPDPPPLPGLLAGLSIMRSSCSRKAITTISCSNGHVTLAPTHFPQGDSGAGNCLTAASSGGESSGL